MKITHNESGKPYSDDFLNQLYDDLHQLAIDYEKAGGSTYQAEKLLKAATLVKNIERNNDEV